MGDWDLEDRQEEARKEIAEQKNKGTRPNYLRNLLKKENIKFYDLDDRVGEHLLIYLKSHLYYLDLLHENSYFRLELLDEDKKDIISFRSSNVGEILGKIKEYTSLSLTDLNYIKTEKERTNTFNKIERLMKQKTKYLDNIKTYVEYIQNIDDELNTLLKK